MEPGRAAALLGRVVSIHQDSKATCVPHTGDKRLLQGAGLCPGAGLLRAAPAARDLRTSAAQMSLQYTQSGAGCELLSAPGNSVCVWEEDANATASSE